MIDLHQGFSGHELEPGKDAGPTVVDVAMAQLEAVSSATRGRWRLAAKQQMSTWRLLARAATHAIKSRLPRH